MPQNQELQSPKQLQEVVNKCQFIIDGLETNGAWEKVIEDFKLTVKDLDDTWHFVKDEKIWFEYRITKMASMKVLHLIEGYRQDKVDALQKLQDLNPTEDTIVKDFDNA